MKKLLTLTAVGAVMFASSQANASGFFIREQSTAGMSNAFAGATAGAEDISYSFWNPAGLTRHEGSQINGNLIAINPHVTGESGNQKARHVVENAVVPSMYFSNQLNDKFTLGFSLTAPFGLVTDYSDNFPNSVGHDTLSEVTTYNFNTMLAYKATDKLSLGAGFVVQYIDATLGTATSNTNVEVAGDTADIGYTLGALYEFTDATRVGVGYRSKIDHKLKGDATYSANSYNQDITAKLTTPEVLSFGAYHDVNSQWSVMAEAQRTGWASFGVLDIINSSTGSSLSTVPENWKDSWFYSVGANYKLTCDTTLRFGVAFDQTPVSDEYKTMRIPDSDRIWYSAGVSHQYNDNLTVNLGYTYIRAEDSSVNLAATGDSINYTGNIHLFGLGFNYNF